MEDFGAIFGSLPLTRLGRRQISKRQLQEEARIGESPPPTNPDRSLSDHVPSSLIPLEDRVRALAVGGAPAWSRRLRRIHDLTVAVAADLDAAWQSLAIAPRMTAERFAVEWRRRAEAVDFAEINELVDRHNRYFPAEANLAMDVHTRDYVGHGGGDYRQRHLDAAWVLDRFPADLEAARAAAVATMRGLTGT